MFGTFFGKRMISMVCVLSMLSWMFTQSACALKVADASLQDVDGLHYQIRMENRQDFTITSAQDGQAQTIVTGHIGSDMLQVDEVVETAGSSYHKQYTVNVSDMVKKVEHPESYVFSKSPLGTYPMKAGTIIYRVLGDQFYDYPLEISYEIVGQSVVEEYELRAEENMKISIFVGAILAATGVGLAEGVVASIIGILGGAVSGGIISKGASGYFTGTKYDYNVKVENRNASPSVVKEYNGCAFDGRYRKGNASWITGKVYDRIYPQFIREHDTGVATWLFNDFFTGTFEVSRWDSLI